MEMMNKWFPLIITALVVVMSCRDSFSENPAGSVRFDMQTAPYAALDSQTKVSYTDDFTGNIERLDWVNGDLIRVYSPHTRLLTAPNVYDNSVNWADYQVEKHFTYNNYISRATVKAMDDRFLFFGETGTHQFRGMYPSPSEAPAGFSFSEGTVTAAMPSVQTVSHKAGTANPAVWYPKDMRYATLLAVSAPVDPPFDENTSVNLPFYPQYTAYEFEINAGVYQEVTVTGFSMTCTEGYLTASAYQVDDGKYFTGANYEVSNDVQVNGPGQKIDITFEGGLTVKKSEGPARFTVLALPQTHANITLSFSLDKETVPRRITLKTAEGFPLEFGPYKKHRIRGLSFPKTIGVVISDEDTVDWKRTIETLQSVSDPILWDMARIFVPVIEGTIWED